MLHYGRGFCPPIGLSRPRSHAASPRAFALTSDLSTGLASSANVLGPHRPPTAVPSSESPEGPLTTEAGPPMSSGASCDAENKTATRGGCRAHVSPCGDFASSALPPGSAHAGPSGLRALGSPSQLLAAPCPAGFQRQPLLIAHTPAHTATPRQGCPAPPDTSGTSQGRPAPRLPGPVGSALVTRVRACGWPASGSGSVWSRPGTRAGVQGRVMDSRPEAASTRLNLDSQVAPRTRHQNRGPVPATATRGLGAEPKSRRTLVPPPPRHQGTHGP